MWDVLSTCALFDLPLISFFLESSMLFAFCSRNKTGTVDTFYFYTLGIKNTSGRAHGYYW